MIDQILCLWQRLKINKLFFFEKRKSEQNIQTLVPSLSQHGSARVRCHCHAPCCLKCRRYSEIKELFIAIHMGTEVKHSKY